MSSTVLIGATSWDQTLVQFLIKNKIYIPQGGMFDWLLLMYRLGKGLSFLNSNRCIFLKISLMESASTQPDGEILKSLIVMKMPFGKYKGTVLCNLPVSYLEWFARKGFPPGKMGMLLATLYEIKINGLEYLLNHLKNGPK